MYIIEVIPLTTLPPQIPQVLSYFFDRELPSGAIVKVLLNKRPVTAVVIASESLETRKATVKKSAFQLKQIVSVVSEQPLVSTYQLSLARWLAHEYYAPLGMALKAVLPPFFGVKRYVSDIYWPLAQKPELPLQKPHVVVCRLRDFIISITPFLRQTGDTHGQTLIVVPDIALILHLQEALIKFQPYIITGSISNAQSALMWRMAGTGAEAVFLGTRNSLLVPYKNLQTIIVLDPDHEAFKSDQSPKFQAINLAGFIAQYHHAKLVLATTFPSAGIQHHIEERQYDFQNKRKEVLSTIAIIDMAQERTGGNFSLLSRELQTALHNAIVDKKRILLYSGRRAYAAILACKNCGRVVYCSQCTIPMRVHRLTESMLVCYRCNAYRNLPDRCENCASKELFSAGAAGSQKIKEEVEKFLQRRNITGIPVFILDTDLIRTSADEVDLMDQIAKAPQSIVVATQLIFSHRISEQFDLVAIQNADALLNSTDFRTEERFLAQIEKLLDFSPKHMVIQTLNPKSSVMTIAGRGPYSTFYAQELAARQSLAWPPFSKIIKLTYRHQRQDRASTAARVLADRLRMVLKQLQLDRLVHIFGPTPAAALKENNWYIYSLVIKTLPGLDRLDKILKFVPSDWNIDVDPRNL